jgi:hypothetical protein
MRSSKIILAMCLGASAWAQTLPPKPQAHPPVEAKPSAVQTPSSVHSATPSKIAAPAVKSSVAPLVPSAKPILKTVSTPAAMPVEHPARRKYARANVIRTKSAGQPLVKAATIGGGQPSPVLIRGQRDPFVSPVVERVASASACVGSGRKCLEVGEITLHGVVSSPNGFIAVVVNGEHTYFLRENDPLANGAVERITRDAIVLRERSSDALGRPFTHEVTKKLGVPAV